jgi:AcrR family transcriptional regulator
MATDQMRRPRKRTKGHPSAADSLGAQAIVDATRELLKTEHPKDITAKMIARQAGGDPRLLTYYFGSKAKLMEVVAAQMILEFRERVAKTDERLPAAEQLRARVRTYLDFARENPFLTQMIADHLMRAEDPGTQAIRAQTLEASLHELQEIVSVGANGSHLRSMDPRFLLAAVMALSQFPYANRDLFEAVVGEPVSDELLDRYGAFMTCLILAVPDAAAGAG